MKRILLFGFALLAWYATDLKAQDVPQGINYQTIVRDIDNHPLVDAQVSLLFQMRDGTGLLQYAEKQTKMTNSNGLINLIVGQGTPLNSTNFQTIDWSAGPKTLTVSIESSPDVYDELSTMLLMSVPYALYSAESKTAATADNLANLGASPGQVLQWNGNTWVPVSLPPVTGDDWGVQSAQVGTTLSGNGTIASPLDVAIGGITNVQILDGAIGSQDLADNAVTNAKVADNAVNTAELANGAVTAPKLNQMGASTDQVLRWNGTAWAPSTLPPVSGDDWGTQSAQVGAALTGNGTSATPLNVATGGITTTHLLDGTVATTDLADNAVANAKMADNAVNTAELADNAVTIAKLADNAVNTAELANGAVTAPKLNQMGASTDQVLRWNGTAWAPSTLPPVSGDDWGTQSAQVGAALTGNGTNATPLNVATGGITTTHLLDGTVATIDLADNAVTNAKMADNAVNTTELANGAVTAPKLNQMGASTDQVLRWNGTAWAPSTLPSVTGDDWGSQSAQVGAALTGNGTNATPLNVATGGITTTHLLDGTVATIDLADNTVTNAKMADNAVNTTELANGAVTAPKLNQMGASTDQVLRWNGTAWAPSTLPPVSGDDWGTQSAQVGAALTGNGTNATPLNVATDGITTIHLLDGTVATIDLADNAVTNAKMADNAVNTAELANGAVTAPKLNQMGASTDQVLRWNGTAWAPSNLPPATGDNWGTQSVQVGAALTGNGSATPLNVATGGITTTHLLDGTVATIDLADNTVTNAKMADNAVNTAELVNGAVTAPKLNQMGATTDQVLRWNGTAWAPATFAYTSCGRVNSPDGQERIMISNQGICPAGAQLEVNTTLAEGAYIKVNGAGDVKGARVEATGGSGSNDGVILFSRSDNNEANGINLATGRNGNTTDAIGLRIMSGLYATTMDDVNYDVGDGNGQDQNYGVYSKAYDNSDNNSDNANYSRNRDIAFFGEAENASRDWAGYFKGGIGIIGEQTPVNGDYHHNELTLIHGLRIGTDLNHGLKIQNIGNNGTNWTLYSINNNAQSGPSLAVIEDQNTRGWFQSGTGQYVQGSDSKLKRDIQDIGSVMPKLIKLKPKRYSYLTDRKQQETMGFIAQELVVEFPEFVRSAGEDDLTFGIDYAGLSVIAIKAIQEQQQIIETQQTKLEKQENRLTALEKEMAEMKALLKASPIKKSDK